MALYPSLEDMKFDQMARAQLAEDSGSLQQTQQVSAPVEPMFPGSTSMYPHLGEYMGLELSEEVIALNMPEYLPVAIRNSAQVVSYGGAANMIAPLSSQSSGLVKAQVTNGIRELTLCKDAEGKIGLRVKDVNNGVFVCLVTKGSPASLAGLRFGDQILQINGTSVAGYSMDKVHDLLKKSPVNGISVVVRDRPFERTLTLHKDSTGHMGFQHRDGKIVSIVKDSSAARNGLLTDHNLLEVNGQNVIGVKDKELARIIESAGAVVTVTVVPSFIYEHIVKTMNSSLIKKLMDHSVPTM